MERDIFWASICVYPVYLWLKILSLTALGVSLLTYLFYSYSLRRDATTTIRQSPTRPHVLEGFPSLGGCR